MSEQIQVDKHVYAIYNKDGRFKTKPLSQPDYGRVLVLQGVELPESYEVYFSNTSNNGKAKCHIGNADGVVIPDEYVVSGRTIYAWYFLHADGTSGQNEFMVIIPNNAYGVHDDAEPTPVQQSAIDEAILALQQALYEAGVTVSHYPQVGEDGYWYTWDMANGEWVSTGVKAQGNPGLDGDSPTITVENITGGHRITIIDADHPNGQIVDVMNGTDGDDGRGIVSVEKTGTSGLVDTYTITYTSGSPSTFTVVNGQNGSPGSDGTDAYVYIRYAANEPTSDADMKTTPDAWMGIYSGDSATAPTTYTSYTWYKIKGENGTTPTVPVTDVQVNGTSVLSNGVANVPIAGNNGLGVVRYASGQGIYITSAGNVMVNPANSTRIKEGTDSYNPITPNRQHESAFYALAKAAGDSSQASSSNAVGVYTDDAKLKIQQMLGLWTPKFYTKATCTEDVTNFPGNQSSNALQLDDVEINIWEEMVILIYQSNSANGENIASNNWCSLYVRDAINSAYITYSNYIFGNRMLIARAKRYPSALVTSLSEINGSSEHMNRAFARTDDYVDKARFMYLHCEGGTVKAGTTIEVFVHRFI